MADYNTMKEVVDIMDYVGSNLTHKGESFYTLCTDFCQINEPVRQYYVSSGKQRKRKTFENGLTNFLKMNSRKFVFEKRFSYIRIPEWSCNEATKPI